VNTPDRGVAASFFRAFVLGEPHADSDRKDPGDGNGVGPDDDSDREKAEDHYDPDVGLPTSVREWIEELLGALRALEPRKTEEAEHGSCVEA